MMKTFKYLIFLLFLAVNQEVKAFYHSLDPKITFVIVVDQLSYQMLNKYKSHLKYGIKTLLNKGVCYHDARYPHAIPTTPTGHAAISTGAWPCVHGINFYGWLDEQNNFVKITDDSNAKVFAPEGTYDYGRSPKNLMCDTISDQFMLNSESPKHAEVVAFSQKSRSSMMLAGHMGKAFWIDDQSGEITTSKYYFDDKPKWLKKFNKKFKLKDGQVFKWRPFYNKGSSAYTQYGSNNYRGTAQCDNFSVNRKFTIDFNSDNPLSTFKRSPYSSHLLINAAKSYLRKNTDKNLLVYLSLSNFDISGHQLGPDNQEQADLLYYLDYQIGKLMAFVNNLFGTKQSLFILTSDHGVMPVPEVMQDKGFNLAERIDLEPVIKRVNDSIEKEFGYKEIIKSHYPPQIYLDKIVTDRISEKQHKSICNKVKKLLLEEESINRCWTKYDLESGISPNNDFYDEIFAKQYYNGRSGDLTYLVQPYKLLTTFKTGTSHYTPYRYNTHVPLIFYQRLKLGKKNIHEPVSMLQLASSQCQLMNVTSPSTSERKVLPHLCH